MEAISTDSEGEGEAYEGERETSSRELAQTTSLLRLDVVLQHFPIPVTVPVTKRRDRLSYFRAACGALDIARCRQTIAQIAHSSARLDEVIGH